jgi:O-antigen/teichoic acid export membrane protein
VLVEAVRTGTLLPLFLLGSLTVERLAVSMLVTCSLLAAYVVLVRLRRAGVRLTLGPPTTREASVAAHLSTSLFSASVKTDGDNTALHAYGHDHAAGLYGAAYRIVQLALVPLRSMNTALLPRFLDVEGRPATAHRRRVFGYASVAAAISAVLVSGLLLGAPVVRLLLGDEFAESVAIIRWLLPLIPIIALGQAPSNGLAALDRLAARTWILAGTAVLSVALYIALVPAHSWRGAVVASIIGDTVLTAAMWVAFLHYDRKDSTAAAGDVEPVGEVALVDLGA